MELKQTRKVKVNKSDCRYIYIYIYIGSWDKWRSTTKWRGKISDETGRKGPGTQWIILLSLHCPDLLSGVPFCGSEAEARRAESTTPSFQEDNKDQEIYWTVQII